jgi:segregation and condensation protein A
MTDYRVRLEVFEGPLDLLLHLVKKHELDILAIPVAFVTEKYLEYLELMRRTNLDVAGEYLLMAATLAHIKSRELLPTPDPSQDEPLGGEDGEEALDPRQELIKRLLEYQKYKDAAATLGDRPVVGRNVFVRGTAPEDAVPESISRDAPLAEVPVFKLLEALADVLAKARVRLTHEVELERLSITDRIVQLSDRLAAEGTFTFGSCFAFLDGAEASTAQLRHEIVVTFLAILEMARLRMVRIFQPPGSQVAGRDADIHITRAVPPDEPNEVEGPPPSQEDYR